MMINWLLHTFSGGTECDNWFDIAECCGGRDFVNLFDIVVCYRIDRK